MNSGNKRRVIFLNTVELNNEAFLECNRKILKISNHFKPEENQSQSILIDADFCYYRRFNSFDGKFYLFENEFNENIVENRFIDYTIYKKQLGFIDFTAWNKSNSSVKLPFDIRCDEIDDNPIVLHFVLAVFASILFSVLSRVLRSGFVAFNNRNRTHSVSE